MAVCLAGGTKQMVCMLHGKDDCMRSDQVTVTPEQQEEDKMNMSIKWPLLPREACYNYKDTKQCYSQTNKLNKHLHMQHSHRQHMHHGHLNKPFTGSSLNIFFPRFCILG